MRIAGVDENALIRTLTHKMDHLHQLGNANTYLNVILQDIVIELESTETVIFFTVLSITSMAIEQTARLMGAL